MRVAMITDGAAVGRDTSDLATALTRLGHDIVVYGNAHRTWRRRTDAATWFAGQWRDERPEVVHNRSRIAGAAAVAAATDLAIPVVHSASAAEDSPVDTNLALRADRVIASCHAELAHLVARKVPRNRISVVPYAVDVEHFTPEGDCQPTGHRYRLVAVGDLNPGSGFATAVAALAGLPDTELIIAGAPAHGIHAKELRKYARRFGVSDRLSLRGPATRAALPSLLRSADIVLATPWGPHFGITALEAAACGITVVATATGGLSDIVVDRITGVLVPLHRPRALAVTVANLLAHPVQLGQLGAAARDRAESRYSWNQIAVDTLTAYQRASAAGPATTNVISLRQTRTRESAHADH